MTYETLRRKTKEELIEMIIQEDLKNVDNSKEALKELWNLEMDYNQENFILLCLSNSNRVLKKKILFKGGVNSSTVDLKILFEEILTTKKSKRFIIAHNHPSGSMNPSKPDLEVTRKIKEGSKILGLDLLDHIIFSERKFYSFLEEGII